MFGIKLKTLAKIAGAALIGVATYGVGSALLAGAGGITAVGTAAAGAGVGVGAAAAGAGAASIGGLTVGAGLAAGAGASGLTWAGAGTAALKAGGKAAKSALKNRGSGSSSPISTALPASPEGRRTNANTKSMAPTAVAQAGFQLNSYDPNKVMEDPWQVARDWDTDLTGEESKLDFESFE